MDQTTMLDVLSGEDEHWSADGLRDLFGPALEQAAAEEAAEGEGQDEQDKGEAPPRRNIDDKGTW